MHVETERDPAVTEVLGKVASPPNKEATCDQFLFWVRRDAVVERTQLVTTTSRLGGRDVRFYAQVTEVFRQGRSRNVAEASDAFDGDVGFEPPFVVPGVTFATATILRTEPAVLAPPMEGSDVILGGAPEARVAYGADEIDEGRALPLGLIKNGGTRLAGPGAIDLDYLLGENGGHMNVNGVAGRATKSSFLLHVIYMLLQQAQHQRQERPSDPQRLRVVPIVLNVKNFDLFHIHRPSTRYEPDRDESDWQALGVASPLPFEGVTLRAAQSPRTANAVETGDTGGLRVQPYSWGLGDVIEGGLFRFLFAEDDINDDNFEALVLDVEARLTREVRRGDALTRQLDDQHGEAATFRGLLSWFDTGLENNGFPRHHAATCRKFQRRLFKLVQEGEGVLRGEDARGHPLDVRRAETCGPIVVDLHALARTPSMQRFVVAAVFRQLVDARTGAHAVDGLRYLVMLDELNRFAPRQARDPITRLIETVAAEMRSQGIILLGAQQQASLVSTRVIENAGIRVLGRSGSMELGRDVWGFLSPSTRRRAEALGVAEKLIIQDNFREPMLVRVPRPPWALNRHEARAAEAGRDRVRDEFD